MPVDRWNNVFACAQVISSAMAPGHLVACGPGRFEAGPGASFGRAADFAHLAGRSTMAASSGYDYFHLLPFGRPLSCVGAGP
jgi:hypothetical protein